MNTWVSFRSAEQSLLGQFLAAAAPLERFAAGIAEAGSTVRRSGRGNAELPDSPALPRGLQATEHSLLLVFRCAFVGGYFYFIQVFRPAQRRAADTVCVVDATNRAVFLQEDPESLQLVGLALRGLKVYR